MVEEVAVWAGLVAAMDADGVVQVSEKKAEKDVPTAP